MKVSALARGAIYGALLEYPAYCQLPGDDGILVLDAVVRRIEEGSLPSNGAAAVKQFMRRYAHQLGEYLVSGDIPCRNCGGTGERYDDQRHDWTGEACPVCNGAG